MESPELVVSRTANGAYPTITAALEAAASERRPCRVRIEPGQYEETIELRGELALYAAQGPGTVQIRTSADTVPVNSFGTLTLRGLQLFAEHAVALMVQSGTAQVEDCHLETRAGKGIVSAFASGTSKLTLTACSITGGGLMGEAGQLSIAGCSVTQIDATAVQQRTSGVLEVSGTTIAHTSGHGIHVLGNSSARIQDCSIEDTGAAPVYFGDSAKGSITNCRIERSDVIGVGMEKRASVTVEQCSISGVAGGVQVGGRAAGTVRDCTIANCREFAVSVLDQGELAVAGGAFSGCAIGVGVKDARAQVADLDISAVDRFGVVLGGAVQVSMARSRISGGDYAFTTIDDGTTGTAELSEVFMTGSRRDAVQVGGSVRVTAVDCTAQDSAGGGFDVSASAFLRARGGVLFIDEAYALARSTQGGSGPDFGREAIDELVKLMEDHRDEVAVIAAGYQAEMRAFLNANPGLSSRFARTIDFPAYSPEDLTRILCHLAQEGDYSLDATAQAAVLDYFLGAARAGTPNGRDARTLFETMTERQAERLSLVTDELTTQQLTTLLAEDLPQRSGGRRAPDAMQTRSLLAELDAMPGLDAIKDEIKTLIAQIDVNRQRAAVGLAGRLEPASLVFTGPPGTGKTTVARLYGRLLASLGVLSGTNFVEASRADLVAGYVGQTAQRTTDVFERARGGVLFIDEAYTLSPPAESASADFGHEVVETLLGLMEDHRDEIAVIIAGYGEQMSRFLGANPGLASRFARTLEFPGYSAEVLGLLFERAVAESDYTCADGVVDLARQALGARRSEQNFGNARAARTLAERTIAAQARRITAGRAADQAAASTEELTVLTLADLHAALDLTNDGMYHIIQYIGSNGDSAAARDLVALVADAHRDSANYGPEHPVTLAVRIVLAHWTGLAGDAAGARDQLAALLPVSERVLGSEHQITLSVRNSLARWAQQAGDAAPDTS